MTNKTHNFRRDVTGTRHLIEYLMQEKGMTLLEIGQAVGKAESQVSRWKSGVVPRGKTFECLKQLLIGSPIHPPETQVASGDLKLILSKLDDLRKDVNEMRESIGGLKDRMTRLETKEEESEKKISQLWPPLSGKGDENRAEKSRK